MGKKMGQRVVQAIFHELSVLARYHWLSIPSIALSLVCVWNTLAADRLCDLFSPTNEVQPCAPHEQLSAGGGSMEK